MNLYPRLCSSFLRRSSNNRCSLSSDLFVNLSGRRLETICYSYRPSLPRSAHAASRLVLFLLVESSSRPFEARFPPLWELSSRLEPALSLSSGKCHLSRVFSMFTRQLDTVCTRPREFSLPALCPLRIRYVIFGFSFFSLVENCSWLADIRGEKFYQQKNWKFFQSCSSSSLPLVIPVLNVWFLMFYNESMISRTFFFSFLRDICNKFDPERRDSSWISIQLFRLEFLHWKAEDRDLSTPKRPNLISIRSWKCKTREQNPPTIVLRP